MFFRRPHRFELPLKQVLRDHRASVIASMLVTWMLTAAIVVVILMTPTLMQRLQCIAPTRTLVGSVAATWTLTVSIIVVGALLDRFGAVPISIIGVSFSYNVAYAIFGGLTPIVVQLMLGHGKLGPAHHVTCTAVIGVAAVVVNAARGANHPTGPIAE